MSNITLNIKGKVWFRRGLYHWSVVDPKGQKMAGGEEHQLHHAFQNTYDVVSAIRAWIMFGRGDLHARTKFLTVEFQPQNRVGSI